MFTFLLVVQALIAASLVGVILMQQSEGGGLGMGGSPTGLMSARGAANFLTKATAYLAVTFVGLSIALAVLATQKTAPTTIDTSLARKPLPAAPAPVVPLSGDPAAAPAPTTTAPAPEPGPAVPLAASPKPEAAAPKPVVSKPVVAAPKPIATKPVVAAPPPVTSTVPAPTPAPAPSPVGPPAENK
jgi:preprotein translocase subunit SecG